ncbi:hypothetical protein E2C01_047525 [Portunus trituberculatus]|uniref:Uncharacterized protein n=1 Tax=Portunus trituberculatus TaxID=210409 RepID=A0A5B7G7U0_PORTR|nr:hypothetical protein [Portunus trituberculatus]
MVPLNPQHPQSLATTHPPTHSCHSACPSLLHRPGQATIQQPTAPPATHHWPAPMCYLQDRLWRVWGRVLT